MSRNVDLIRRAFVCTLAAAPAAWAQGGPERAVAPLGRWRLLTMSKGGIGSMLEFRDDGALDYSPAAVVELSYRVDGQTLILPPATVNGPERESIEWLGDDRVRFRSAAAGDPGQEFARVGGRESGEDRLRGEWLGSRDMGGRSVTVLRFFREGGRGLLLIPFVAQRGRYSVVSTGLHLEIPGRPPWDAGFTVANNVLTLTDADGQQTKYERY